MKFNHGLHLAYCTNIHRGENWEETYHALKTHTLAVRDRVSKGKPYAIGLRLSNQAAIDLSDSARLDEFRAWLDKENCYVFTINGFPFGRFHGARVKEQVYSPDWTSHERVDYTNLLFDILAQIVPEGVEGSVSTLPGSFKEFIRAPDQELALRSNLWRTVEHIATLSEKSGKKLHLGMEPEPLGLFETTEETIRFFEKMRSEHPKDARLTNHLGVNYDTCHLAVEFEEPKNALSALQKHGIKISKLHLSSAIKMNPSAQGRSALAAFADDIYLHQVIVRTADGKRIAYKDLGLALKSDNRAVANETSEWRVHFHIPLHNDGSTWFASTSDHVLGVFDRLKAQPEMCSHLEMETYTWEVLPSALKNRNVVDQLVAEYEWTVARMGERGFKQLHV